MLLFLSDVLITTHSEQIKPIIFNVNIVEVVFLIKVIKVLKLVFHNALWLC